LKARYAAVLAAIPLMLIGAGLVLFPFGNPGQMQDDIPVGTMPSIRLGTAIFVSGVVLLVAGLIGSLTAGSRSPAPLAPPAAPRDLGAPPPTPSSEVEAAVVKLLDEDEKLLYLRLRDQNREVLQRDIVRWGTFSAAKVSRLLDRLERKGLAVRERHGMTNRVRLTHRPARLSVPALHPFFSDAVN
jgi:uncharacterized membrane protein